MDASPSSTPSSPPPVTSPDSPDSDSASPASSPATPRPRAHKEAKEQPSQSPLMSNLNRLSNATSRPNIPPRLDSTASNGYGYGHRPSASRSFSLSRSIGYWTGTATPVDDDADEQATPIDTSFGFSGPSSSIDLTKVLYPTLENHPPPLEHPLLVLDLAQLTSVPSTVSNDELLAALLRRLEPWVGEEDDGAYCLVILAADDSDLPGKGKARSLPGVTWWLWNWRRIPRKYRKNLKRLYIVHPSQATKTLLPVVLPMMSPKAYAKLFVVPSLAELTQHGVSLRGIDLSIPTLLEEAAARQEAPPATPAAGAIQWGLSALTSAVGAATSYLQGTAGGSKADLGPIDPYWGQEIDDIVSEAGGVPRVIEDLGRAIYTECTDTEGIFRRTGGSPVLAGLRSVLNAPLALQPRVDWALIAAHDPLLPPTLLKRLLAGLPSPVVPSTVYPVIKTIRTPTDIRTQFLPALSPGRATLLNHVVHIAHHLLSSEPATRMGAHALAITLAPTLINGPDPREDTALCLAPGQALPGLGVKAEEQTLVGLLEMWIRNWAEVDGEPEGTQCSCGLKGKDAPLSSPIKLGGSTRSSLAGPVESA